MQSCSCHVRDQQLLSHDFAELPLFLQNLFTPLLSAAIGGHEATVRLFVQHEADVNEITRVSLPAFVSEPQLQPVDLVAAPVANCFANDNPALLLVTSQGGYTPLHLVLRHAPHPYGVAITLLESGANPHAITDVRKIMQPLAQRPCFAAYALALASPIVRAS